MTSTRFVQFWLGSFLALSFTVLATMAQAHAEFRGSDPAQDALLDRLPYSVTLRFSEEVGVLVLDWLLPDGSSVAATGQAETGELRVDAPPDAGRGTYVLRWRVASADGHPVGGALVFSVGQVTGAATAADASHAAIFATAARWGFVAALVLCVGAAVFHHLIAPVSLAYARRVGLMAGFVPAFGLIWLGVEGADRLGLPPLAGLSWQGFAAGLASPALVTVALGVLAAGMAWVALRVGSGWAGLVAWGAAALSFSVSGHALSAPGSVAPVLTALHAGAVIFWPGGLPALAVGLREEGRLALLQRFSVLALPVVAVLIGSGAGLALIHRDAPDLLTSDWARLLAVKLALVAVMLALALWHRFRSMPQLAQGGNPPLRRSIGAEAVLGLIVLALAMGFRLAPPPAAMAALPAPSAIHIHSEKAMADVLPLAPYPGQTGFRLMLADGDFAPLDPLEVTLSLTDTAAGIGPLTARAERQAAGDWDVPPLTLPTAGPWQVQLTLLISDFEQVTLTSELPAGGGQ